MAARGRSRGKSLSSMGSAGAAAGAGSIGDMGLFGKSDSLPPILQPPPSYPSLEYKPIPMNMSHELSYLLQLKKDFADSMQESANYVHPILIKKDIERYSDRYQDFSSNKQGYHTRYDWTRMPTELKAPVMKKVTLKNREKRPVIKEKLKEIDINTKLQELEKKETTQQSDAEEEGKDEEEEEEKDVEDKPEEEEEELDEEMDEGTDYINNYFDNGENYEDDEENVDDGAIF